MTIVVFGSVVQDLISYTPRFPRPGESVCGTSFLAGPGGKGANQAVAAAKLGANVEIIARVGSDIFGEANIKSLNEANVGTKSVQKVEQCSTATATITVSEEGENSIVVVLGANEKMSAEVAKSCREQIGKATLLMCQNEVPQCGNRTALQMAREQNVTTFYNPAPGNSSLEKSILALVDIVCTNENEAEFLTDIKAETVESAFKAAEKMLEMGPHTAIVTLGPKGVILARKNEKTVHIPVLKVTAVDTTGAGDCFCGSLAYFLTKMKDLPVEEAVKRASIIAAHCVTRKGTQASYRSREELEQLDKSLF
ncbi:unnamed protein product, partial [Mesorhabditis belari]|uniref:Ribokinase n=1 Tax=Mesorhabditis belari TaxID=2138241 RepID=A0AAF3FFN2_9BILA